MLEVSLLGIQTAGVNQSVHSFLGGKGLGIQQGTSVWVVAPKPTQTLRYTSDIGLIFLVPYLLYIEFTFANLCCTSKSTTKHQQ